MSHFWSKIRKDFPITKKGIYLDHAAGGPIPLPVYSKIQKYYRENIEQSDFAWNIWIKRREEVRAKVAKFIGARPEEITFISSTSQGMNYIAEMLVSRGSVLTDTSEFPSSTIPWIWRKADIIWQQPEKGEISLSKLRSLLTPKVKTIVTSFVQYGTGFKQDLETLGKIKGKRFLVVNATQGFGAFPIDVKKANIDFLCTNSYKWLMAGYGGGVLYINKKWLGGTLQPGTVGWRSMVRPELMDNRKIDVKADASSFELGCPSFPNIFAVGAAVEYFSQIGMEKISQRLLELTDYLIQGLEKKGMEILSPRKFRSGIVVFKVKDLNQTWKKLMAKKIYTSPRGGGLRVAPHFYNSFEEIDQLLKEVSHA